LWRLLALDLWLRNDDSPSSTRGVAADAAEVVGVRASV
jgi:hypothetical protein